MPEAPPHSPPAWQTEELQDEWVELDEDASDDDGDNLTYGTRSISLTTALATHIHTNSDYQSGVPSSANVSSAPVGTFLIREDVQNVPLLPKTPGRQKKGLIKDFFSPMPLERMFEPPSPPPASNSTLQPSAASGTSHSSQTRRDQSPSEDEILETDMPDMASFHGRKASIACQFTFAVPREASLNPNSGISGAFPLAQSTPTPPFAPNSAAPVTDPRLRLFQFQYDTYTREHLSAMVDSIAINTPSGTGSTPSPTSLSHGLSRVSEVTGSANMSHLRSTKRVKLSPRSDFYGEGAGAGASIARPRVYAKDYVGESRSLMQQIKQARDFSTISTVASTQHDSPASQHDDHDERHPPGIFTTLSSIFKAHSLFRSSTPLISSCYSRFQLQPIFSVSNLKRRVLFIINLSPAGCCVNGPNQERHERPETFVFWGNRCLICHIACRREIQFILSLAFPRHHICPHPSTFSRR